MSCWTTTVPNSVRNSAPVGQTSRQPACVQCLQTSEAISQRNDVAPSAPVASPGLLKLGMPRSWPGATVGAGASAWAAAATSGAPRSCAVDSGLVPSPDPPRSALRSSGSTASCIRCVPDGPVGSPASPGSWRPVVRGCSMNATWRQEFAPSEPVLSKDMPSMSSPSSGTAFQVLHATSQALQPMQIEVSVKKPTRGGWLSAYPASPAGSARGPERLLWPVMSPPRGRGAVIRRRCRCACRSPR